MSWIYLFIAGLFEVGWAISLKFSCGFTRFWPSVATAACILISMVMFSLSLRGLPIGTAYAIWTGMGVVGTTCVGMLFFDEARDLARLICILFFITGIAGLKLTSTNAG